MPRLIGNDPALVQISGIGKVILRRGESDLSVLRQIFVDKEYDIGRIPSVAARANARYHEILDSGRKPVVVDAGANIGLASIWYRLTYPEAAIIAVEPEPGNVAILKRNLAGLPDITVLAAAVGSQPGFVEVRNDSLSWATQTERAEHGVPVITMADAFARAPNGVPFVAKIDIEGFESDLFANNLDWLDDVCIVTVEPHDWLLPSQKTSQPLQSAMAQHDFEIFILGENLVYARI